MVSPIGFHTRWGRNGNSSFLLKHRSQKPDRPGFGYSCTYKSESHGLLFAAVPEANNSLAPPCRCLQKRRMFTMTSIEVKKQCYSGSPPRMSSMSSNSVQKGLRKKAIALSSSNYRRYKGWLLKHLPHVAIPGTPDANYPCSLAL